MNHHLTLGWLYPDLMSTYGDRGNVIVLEKRAQWRRITLDILPITFTTSGSAVSSCDLFLGGGAQDREQELVAKDLREKKGDTLKKIFAKGIPGLFVCGSPQLLGKYYMTADGKKLEGLGLFDYVTKHFGHDKPRCIGNTAGKVTGIDLSGISKIKTIVGFENHGGRTYLGPNTKPFAKVLAGFGNNGEDGFEGAVYKNVIACYYHGPFLPKNPHIADWLLTQALEIKYDQRVQLEPLDDAFEWKAHTLMLSRMNIST